MIGNNGFIIYKILYNKMMYKTEIIMPKDILLASHDILVGLATNDDKKDLIRSYFAVNIKYKTFVMY